MKQALERMLLKQLRATLMELILPINMLKKFIENGSSLTIIVDSGSVAFEPLSWAKEKKHDVIVVDHHTVEEELPDAVGIVNPNRKDQEEGYGHVCAAGMAFIFVIAINRELKNKNWYEDNSIKPLDLRWLLDLVALGTVCDVVPLKTINRAFVQTGLGVMNKKQNIYIKKYNTIPSPIALNRESSPPNLSGW